MSSYVSGRSTLLLPCSSLDTEHACAYRLPALVYRRPRLRIRSERDSLLRTDGLRVRAGVRQPSLLCASRFAQALVACSTRQPPHAWRTTTDLFYNAWCCTTPDRFPISTVLMCTCNTMHVSTVRSYASEGRQYGRNPDVPQGPEFKHQVWHPRKIPNFGLARPFAPQTLKIAVFTHTSAGFVLPKASWGHDWPPVSASPSALGRS